MKGLSMKNLYGLRRLQGGLLVLFTLLILLLLNASAWWTYWKIGGSLEEIFSRSLKEAAELAALSLSRMPNVGIPARNENSVEYLTLQAHLIRLREAGRFTDLFLIDPTYRNLVGVYPDFSIGQVDGLLVLDRELLEEARLGQTALTPATETNGLYLKTAYAPVYGPSQRVEAILVAKADVEYLKPKIAIRSTLIVITALAGLLVLLVAFGYWQSLRALQRIESQITHNERLAGLGQLAAGVAHELRNPLGIIEQTMTVLRRRYEREPDEVFEYIPSEVARMNRIISEFLNLARERPLEIGPADLAAVLDRTLGLLDHRLREHGIEVRKAYPDALPIAVDADKMQQVFLNLCINAIEAMPEGGRLAVQAEAKGAGSGVAVTVEDTGRGMSLEEVRNTFDLFYTTKPNGTGLGLSVARQIVAQHGGRLDIDSAPGKGTRIRVTLPGRPARHRSESAEKNTTFEKESGEHDEHPHR